MGIYDWVHLGLLGVVVAMILAGSLSFEALALVIVLMLTVMLFRIMDLEGRPAVDKASKLKEAEMFDALEAKISKLRKHVEERMQELESRMVEDAVLDERLERISERLAGIEEALRKEREGIGSAVSELSKRVRRLEIELGIGAEEVPFKSQPEK